ncbi:MAG: hypothetical protein WD358_06405 [Nitriliruptoraceae bacterium]
MGRNETEAAYFTLLRARSELDGLQRYGEYLTAEIQRVRRFMSEGDALADTVDRRLRRELRTSDDELSERLRARVALIAEEQVRLPDRIEAAEQFVAECEQHHQQLASRHRPHED